MFSQSSRRPASFDFVFPAQEYLRNINEKSLAGGFRFSAGSIATVLQDLSKAINPGTRLTFSQQAFVRDQLNTVFRRYFLVREQMGEINAQYDRDMKLLGVTTFMNKASNVRPWFPSFGRVESVDKVFDRFIEEQLVPHEVDPERFSDLLLEELRGAVWRHATFSNDQIEYIGRHIVPTIVRYFEETAETGIESAYMRKTDRFLLLVGFCSSCTGR